MDRGKNPSDKNVGELIAEEMGKKIAQGLKGDEWVKAWLDINGKHRAWYAVGMNENGYWGFGVTGLPERKFSW